MVKFETSPVKVERKSPLPINHTEELSPKQLYQTRETFSPSPDLMKMSTSPYDYVEPMEFKVKKVKEIETQPRRERPRKVKKTLAHSIQSFKDYD